MGEPIRVLILEDSSSDTELILHELRQNGFDPDWTRVDTSSGFVDGLHQAPDIILADYQLPQYSALQALDAVSKASLDVPVIIITGSVDESRVVECMQHGACDYLVKDRLSRLGPAVKRALEYRRLQAARSKINELNVRYQLVLEQGRDIILFVRLSDDRILEANQAAASAYGYSHEELIGLTLDTLHHPNSWENLRDQIEKADKTGSLFEATHIRKDGSLFPVEVSAHGTDLGTERVLVCLIRDISERKQAEESLRAANEQLNAILNASPVAIIAVDRSGRVTNWTPSAEIMFGWQAWEVIGRFYPLVNEAMKPKFLDQLERSNAGFNINVHDITRLCKDGSLVHVSIRTAPLHSAAGDVIGTLIILEDISESRRTAEALQQSDAQLGALIDASPLAIVSLDREGRVVTWNTRAEEIFEAPAAQMIGHPFNGYIPQDSDRFQTNGRKGTGGELATVQDIVRKRKDGTQIELRRYTAVHRGPTGDPAGIIGIYSDITDQRRQERERETIIRAASGLRIADKAAEMFPVTLDQLESLLDLNAAAIGLYIPGTSQFKVELARGKWKSLTGKITGRATSLVWNAMREGKPLGVDEVSAEGDPLLVPSSEVRSILAVPLIARNEVIGAVWAGSSSSFQENNLVTVRAIADIAANAIHRAGLFDRMELAYQRLTMLRTIDQAISSSLDLRLVLDLLINQITTQLHLDRALIYLYTPSKQTLDYAIGSGLPTSGFLNRSFRLGESHIGRVALKREMEYTPDLSQVDDEFGRKIFTYDGFVTYIAIPLIAKGQVKGVMEIFHRARIEPDIDWLDFLKALGTQTAIAIDNAELFGQLQRANTNLTLALDSTLEGWSRVLDLRNKDTTNHSQLVTSLVLQIATRMGIPPTEQVHIRRGALLHDIGKAGVPDEILYKPGPLNDEEWKLVRHHPESAVELLRPITYLQPAVTIPAFHHEKWDGSGYPHGLKGEQIPLAARIFAVADVWFALQEDRPFRRAWSQEEALSYLREQRGTQFDPRVVDIFLEIQEAALGNGGGYSNTP